MNLTRKRRKRRGTRSGKQCRTQPRETWSLRGKISSVTPTKKRSWNLYCSFRQAFRDQSQGLDIHLRTQNTKSICSYRETINAHNVYRVSPPENELPTWPSVRASILRCQEANDMIIQRSSYRLFANCISVAGVLSLQSEMLTHSLAILCCISSTLCNHPSNTNVQALKFWKICPFNDPLGRLRKHITTDWLVFFALFPLPMECTPISSRRSQGPGMGSDLH